MTFESQGQGTSVMFCIYKRERERPSEVKQDSENSIMEYVSTSERHTELGSPVFPDYENWHSEVDSAGSCDPYMDYSEGYAEYGERAEYSDISLWSDLGSDYGEDPPMEVEEVLHGDSLADSDVHFVISGND
ncbi:hypothetical protein P4O66_000289 [Electrophorus voltai]|uniref:Uncharacterized protein n=1 Tax=Electrophorus voltai TaxID=2609070 RepID=A0AAD8ZLG4_9TELE|nr:hypothetical protein P4O66_000289 [Electrophorus voltai]